MVDAGDPVRQLAYAVIVLAWVLALGYVVTDLLRARRLAAAAHGEREPVDV